MDSITIYENGCPAGTLTLRREGLYTLLEATLPPSPTLTRLWLCGGGGERADLGVLEPRPDARVFRRRYTRAALSRLPAPMDCAVVTPAGSDTPPAPCHCEERSDAAIRSPSSPRISNLESQNSTPPPAAAERLAASRTPGRAWTPLPAVRAAAEMEGCLHPPPAAAALHSPRISNLESHNSRTVILDGARYLALPCELRHPCPGLRLAELDGQTYLLFRL